MPFRPSEIARLVAWAQPLPARIVIVDDNMSIMLPWFSNLIDEDRALLGDDWWPYGIQRNRSAIDVVLRYHHEQGLTKRRLTIEDVFFPDLLDT